MKTLTSIVLLGLSVGLLNQAVAEPFHNRGGEAITALSAGTDQPHQGAVIPFQGFNNQGVDGVVNLPAGTDQPHRGAVISSQGFNDRSDS